MEPEEVTTITPSEDTKDTQPEKDKVEAVTPDFSELITSIKELKETIQSSNASKEDKKEAQDELDTLLSEEAAYIKENRNPSDWKEHDKTILKLVEERFEKLAEQREVKKIEEAKKAEEATKAQNETVEKQYTAYWEKQLDYLEENNLIPALPKEIKEKLKKGGSLTDEESQNPAVIARADLYDLAINNKDRNGNPDPIDDVEIAFYRLYQPKQGNKVPGEDAPISMGRSHAKSNDSEKLDYLEIHNKSISDLARGK